jgi:hypothetical protein
MNIEKIPDSKLVVDAQDTILAVIETLDRQCDMMPKRVMVVKLTSGWECEIEMGVRK